MLIFVWEKCNNATSSENFKDSAKSKYWTTLAENIVGIARSPQSGWSGAVKKCD